MQKKPNKSRHFRPVSTPVSTPSGVERYLRLGEAAAILGVSRATLYRWLPQIEHRRIPAGGLTKCIVLVSERSLNEFLSRFNQKPSARNAA
jgi:Helix-turn-helix domain